MPFINIKTNIAASGEQQEAIKTALGRAVTVIPGKSESWLMVGIEAGCSLWFKGSNQPAAMVDVSVYGSADPSAFNKLTGEICGILREQLAIDPSRVYVKYSATADWGWNGSNF